MAFKTKYPSKLLAIGSDAKTIKGEKKGVKTAIFYGAPFDVAGRENVCVFSDKDCRGTCLFTAGRSEFTPVINEARIRKTRLFFDENDWFMNKLEREIALESKKAKAEGFSFAVRLNGTSDIAWENMGIMEKFPDVQFYDYSKNPYKIEAFINGQLPQNYHVTFSRSGGNEARVDKVLALGGNVAVVFDTKKGDALPETYKGYKVIDGDESDIRYNDPKNVVVGLRLKGRKIRKNLDNTNTFVVRVADENSLIVA